MKTTNKTIIMALAALVLCLTSVYAEWFGIGGDNHITDDDDLPDIYKFHDYEGKAIQPDMNKGNLGNVKPNIDTENNSYKGINVKPGLDADNYEYPDVKPDMNKEIGEYHKQNMIPDMEAKHDGYEYPGALPDMNTWKKKPTITKGLRKNVSPEIRGRKKSSVLPAGNGGQTIGDLATILNARIKSVVRPYNYTMAQDEDNKGAKLFDTPLIVGVAGFGMILYRLRNTVLSLCVLCCTLNIMFQAFRLWFGVQELKKTYVDIIWKSVCCILLLFSYSSIVDGVMTLASGAGMSLTNGYNDLNRAYKLAAEALYTQAELGVPLLDKVISDSAVANKYVSDETYRKCMEWGYSEGQIQAVIAKKQLIVAKEVITPHEDGPGDDKRFITMDGRELTQSEMDAASQTVCATNFGDALASLSVAATEPTEEKKKKLTAKLHALNEVMDGQIKTETIVVHGYSGGNAIQSQKVTMVSADDLIYAPFLKDKDKHNTTLISPAQMLRTCQTFMDAMTQAAAYDPEALGKIGTADEDPNSNNEKVYNVDSNWTWSGIKSLLVNVLTWISVMLCTVIVMAEYTVTVLEYYIVTSLGALLIPLMFLDSTKEYTKGLLRLFLQFYLKMLVQILAIFFTMSMYIQISVFTFSQNDASLEMLLGTYLGVLAVGLFICGGAGKMAGALLSGQPSMFVGDIAHQAHHMMAAGRMAAGAVSGVGHATIGKRGADGRLHGGMLGAGRAGYRAWSHNQQNTAAKKAGGAAAKTAAMNNFGTAGAGYQSAKGGVGGGQFFSNQDLQAMKEGKASSRFGSAEEQKKKYAALKEEAGERASKGFQHQASSQWWANAAYKFATNGEEKIDEKSKENGGRFTGVGSSMVDENGKEISGNALNVKNRSNQAGTAYGNNADALSFFQKPPEASPITFGNERNASIEAGHGDRKDGGVGIQKK